jgi:hypothetical protein
LPLNIHIRRKLTISLVAVLVIVPIAFVSVHLIKQNYKRHHYVTGTFQYGRYRGQKYRFTEEQQDKINQLAQADVQRAIDAQHKMR